MIGRMELTPESAQTETNTASETVAPASVVPSLVSELRALAIAVARDAAELVRTKRAEIEAHDGLGAHTTTKTSAVDPVTEVDTASEKFIVAALSAARPGDGFLGEEGASTISTTGVTWIVDPIDGTVNFLYGIPEYSVSIGAVVDGEPVAGAVINVARGVVYHAGLGQGAVREFGDGTAEALVPRTEADPALALLATGFGYSAAQRAHQAELLTRLLPQVRDIRRMGSAALDLCRVAEGSVDGYFEHGIKAWDCAAGTIIAREAGCSVRHPGMDADGHSGAVIFAAQPSVEPALWDLLESVGATEAMPA